MKTKQYITSMLIAMVFSTTPLLAQSARRTVPQENKERATATRTQTREVKKQTAKTTQPARQVQPQQQVQRQSNTQPARQVQPQQQVQRQSNTQPARQVQPQQQVQRPRTVENSRKPVSISTQNNPSSPYRKPDSKVYIDQNRSADQRVNKYSTERYYGGHHYHNAYPTTKVNFYHHQDTHVHNYQVLYYPAYSNIYWTRNMYHEYHRWYPNYHWNYPYGYRIQTISAFDAKYSLGEVANVYGRVYATWYNEETNDYLLFFGGDYPNQQLTVVVPARIARKFNWRPERYFLGQHVIITGLITTFDGIPEIVVKDRVQLDIY